MLCLVPTVVDFLQSLLDRGWTPSTLKLYVTATSARHAAAAVAQWGATTWCGLFSMGFQEAMH